MTKMSVYMAEISLIFFDNFSQLYYMFPVNLVGNDGTNQQSWWDKRYRTGGTYQLHG